MNYLKQLAIIFSICIIGEYISFVIPFPFAGSLISMILMFGLLLFKIIKLEQIETTAKFLINILSFLFISTTVSIVQYFDSIKDIAFQLLFICLVSSILTFIVTVWVVSIIVYFTERKK